MNSLVLLVIMLLAYFVAYHTYGRFLGRRIFKLAADHVCPLHELQDDIDYVPTDRSVLFGHHYTSIAGLGPIMGPAIAVIWGWVPAVIWILIGAIFFGAVHDFGALIVSLRHQGRSIGDISADLINNRVRTLFLLLLVVIAVFALIIAILFNMYPQGRTAGLAGGPDRRLAGPHGLQAGRQPRHPGDPGPDPDVCHGRDRGFLPSRPAGTGTEPRPGPDYLDDRPVHLLLYRLHPAGPYPAAAARLHQLAPAPGGPGPAGPGRDLVAARDRGPGLQPRLARGPRHLALPLRGRGLRGHLGFSRPGQLGHLLQAMQLRGRRPLRGLRLHADGGDPLGSGHRGRGRWYRPGTDHRGGHHPAGVGRLQTPLRLLERGQRPGRQDRDLCPRLGQHDRRPGHPRQDHPDHRGGLVSFAAATLDTATRLQRYVIGELAKAYRMPRLARRHTATLIAVGTAFVMAFYNGSGKGALNQWPLFGTINQLLAALALLMLTVYLYRQRVPIVCTMIPMIFMVVMTAWAMVINLRHYFAGGKWLLFGIGIVVFLLEVWMIVELILFFRNGLAAEAVVVIEDRPR